MLFLINILHQTATRTGIALAGFSCSLSIFYIKPQLWFSVHVLREVVPYQYSTSNRNLVREALTVGYVVPYQYSTSNRNYAFTFLVFVVVVPYQYSTSNRNRIATSTP